MKYENFEQFKSHCKSLKSALSSKIQDPALQKALKLSVIQEALAQSLGHANLATFKAVAFAGHDQIVDEMPDCLGSFLLCIEGLLYNDETMEEESFAIVDPEYCSVQDILSTRNWKFHNEKRSEGYCVDRHPELDQSFWDQCYVKAVHIECPSINEYGVPYFGDRQAAPERIAKQFRMKVLRDLDVCVEDRGDDGGTTVFLEVWAPQSVFDTLTDLPLMDNEGHPLVD